LLLKAVVSITYSLYHIAVEWKIFGEFLQILSRKGAKGFG